MRRLILRSFQSPGDDVNVTVRTAYNADGNLSSITAVNSITGDQTTRYVYGTTISDSGIASGLLKRAEIYPDSDDTYSVATGGSPVFSDGIYDRIELKHNRQGETLEIKDQNETVHAFDYDGLGRQIHDRVTALGSGVDGAVRRISTSYEVRGMVENITSWNGETVGCGSVVNEIQFTYDDFGQITADYQAHGGTVNTSTTPKVRYGYASGSANTIRPTTITYPNGRVLTYGYQAADSMDDALSRIGSIIDDDAGSTHLADYSYLGVGPAGGLLPTLSSPFTPGAVEVDYTEPNITYTLVGTAGGNDPDTGDIYRGLDRFGRVKDCYWYNYDTSTDVDRIQYRYERNGNRTYRENTVATALGAYFDELYNHDHIDRLKSMDRGRSQCLLWRCKSWITIATARLRELVGGRFQSTQSVQSPMTDRSRPYTMHEFRADIRRMSISADKEYARVREVFEAEGKPLQSDLRSLEELNDDILSKIDRVMTASERQDPLAVDSTRAEEIAKLAGFCPKVIIEILELHALLRDHRQEYARTARAEWLGHCAVQIAVWGPIGCILLLLLLAIILSFWK